MIEFEVLSKDNIDEVWRLEQECFDDPWTKKMKARLTTGYRSI